jgi:hypothetical protein
MTTPLIFLHSHLLVVYRYWDTAKELLEQALQIMPNDGPSRTVLDYMAGRNFDAPDDWTGCRALTSK